MSGKALYITHAALAVIFCLMAAAGSFCDLDVSRALYSPENIPLRIMTILGQYVIFAAYVFFDGALARQAAVCGTVSKGKKRALCIFCGYLAVSASVIGMAAVLHYECLGAWLPELSLSVPAALISGMLFMFPLFFAGYAAGKKEYDKTLVRRLIKLLIFIVGTTLFIGAVKYFLARPRFRATLLGYDDVVFTPWYSPVWNSADLMEKYGLDRNSFMSFPSGHAIMGIVSIFIFPAMSLVFPKLESRKKLLFAVGLIYGLIVMLSRIVMGAHYLSDISVGALLGVVISFIYYKTDNRHLKGKQE